MIACAKAPVPFTVTRETLICNGNNLVLSNPKPNDIFAKQVYITKLFETPIFQNVVFKNCVSQLRFTFLFESIDRQISTFSV